MKPIDFEGSNEVIAGQVPVNRHHGVILSKWGMSFRERLSILFHGSIWIAVNGDKFPRILVSGDNQFEMIMENHERPFEAK